jgi:hypothetical protein
MNWDISVFGARDASEPGFRGLPVSCDGVVLATQSQPRLARQIPAAGRELDVRANPTAEQVVNVAIDSLVGPEVKPFWRLCRAKSRVGVVSCAFVATVRLPCGIR